MMGKRISRTSRSLEQAQDESDTHNELATELKYTNSNNNNLTTDQEIEYPRCHDIMTLCSDLQYTYQYYDYDLLHALFSYSKQQICKKNLIISYLVTDDKMVHKCIFASFIQICKIYALKPQNTTANTKSRRNINKRY